MEILCKEKAFLESSREIWPDAFEPFFLRPREDGRNLGRNLEGIKADLREVVRKENIDTVFLSLGGAAKILCAELAEELAIRVIDFGAGLRSLAYCGSDGQASARSTHTIYLYRVPFGLYMDALEKAYPVLDKSALLAKAHAQLILEVQEKELGWSHSAWEYEFSAENLIAFRNAFNEYKKRYRHLFRRSAGTVKERREFLHFCGTHGLTLEGKLFLKWFHFKGWIKNMLKWRG